MPIPRFVPRTRVIASLLVEHYPSGLQLVQRPLDRHKCLMTLRLEPKMSRILSRAAWGASGGPEERQEFGEDHRRGSPDLRAVHEECGHFEDPPLVRPLGHHEAGAIEQLVDGDFEDLRNLA